MAGCGFGRNYLHPDQILWMILVEIFSGLDYS